MITVVEHKTFPHSSNGTILESIEKQDIEVHAHCREGFCGACRTKIISGDVEYTTDPLAYFDDDEILPCCCVPKTDVKIEIS